MSKKTVSENTVCSQDPLDQTPEAVSCRGMRITTLIDNLIKEYAHHVELQDSDIENIRDKTRAMVIANGISPVDIQPERLSDILKSLSIVPSEEELSMIEKFLKDNDYAKAKLLTKTDEPETDEPEKLEKLKKIIEISHKSIIDAINILSTPVTSVQVDPVQSVQLDPVQSVQLDKVPKSVTTGKVRKGKVTNQNPFSVGKVRVGGRSRKYKSIRKSSKKTMNKKRRFTYKKYKGGDMGFFSGPIGIVTIVWFVIGAVAYLRAWSTSI